MEELIYEAKNRDMYILMDLVVNHCSDEHEWFKKAKADPEGEYGKYFYIIKSSNGELPSNLRSYFGGSVWENISGTDYYYYHSFHKKQPDLNWENPKLRKEIYKMINWWLDKGLAGFRIDAILNIKKDLPFRMYTPDRDDGLYALYKTLTNHDGFGVFMNEIKEETFNNYDTFTVGEVSKVDNKLNDFIGDDGYFSTIFDLKQTNLGMNEKGWYASESFTPNEYRDSCFEVQKIARNEGLVANIIENHDKPRGVNYFIPSEDLNDYSKKLLAAINIMLKGIPFIYQGQEIGMENIEFDSIDEVDDIDTIGEYKVVLEAGLSEEEALKAVNKYSRDNTRTPFQWDNTINAGFTTGEPWIKVNSNYVDINVKSQEKDKNSLLYFYKKLIALRKAPEYKDTIVYGDFEPAYQEQDNIFAFYRNSKEQKVLLIANFQKEEQSVIIPGIYKKILINN